MSDAAQPLDVLAIADGFFIQPSRNLAVTALGSLERVNLALFPIKDESGQEITLDTRVIDLAPSVLNIFTDRREKLWPRAVEAAFPDTTVKGLLELRMKTTPHDPHSNLLDKKDSFLFGVVGTTMLTILLIDAKLKAGYKPENCMFLNQTFNADAFLGAATAMPKAGGTVASPPPFKPEASLT